MSPESEHQEISPGLYYPDTFGVFDKRQAWTTQLAAKPDRQSMTVGDHEIIWLSRTYKPAPINRAESELELIREVASTGSANSSELQTIELSTRDLSEKIDRLSPPASHLEMAFDVFRSALRAEGAERAEQKIKRAAGYIALRSSLWIVTKSNPAEVRSGRVPLNIGVARLVGLTIEESPYAVPIVSGRNGVWGKLHNVRHDSSSIKVRPRALDVVEGIVTRPKETTN